MIAGSQRNLFFQIVKNANFMVTGLLRVRERSTFQETRIQMVLATNNREYHLYASSSGGKILAMV
jgi:hypothetical protein